MNVFFDVDYTLVDADGFLRPHVKEVFERLVADGHYIYLWSGGGLRWEEIDQHGLRALVRDCFLKPFGNYEAERVRLGVPFRPDYVIDDSSEIVSVFGGYVISPFGSYTKNSQDTEMLRAYEAIMQFTAENGTGSHS